MAATANVAAVEMAATATNKAATAETSVTNAAAETATTNAINAAAAMMKVAAAATIFCLAIKGAVICGGRGEEGGDDDCDRDDKRSE